MAIILCAMQCIPVASLFYTQSFVCFWLPWWLRQAAVLETWIGSLGWEDTLEKEMATHSSTLVWKIPWMEKPGRLESMESQKVRHN